MKDLKLAESEYRFMKVVWENQPLTSAGLVKLCADSMGWKKSTTYTVLKRLGEKEMVKNENSNIIPLVTEKEVQLYESNSVVDRSFGGSLPGFIAAFMDGKKLSKEDADRIRKMIEDFEE
ncbi:MAG: BlaI/MecI/CopY family transcriptional regulator [Oscillospiraceae bacterium]|nr:BlaI/MecI/CopY family transcriptional regulator [Oscillospiraceae bacterium]